MTKQRLFIAILLLSATLASSQAKALSVVIDSITVSETIDNKRKFVVNYQLKNNSGREITFFLNPRWIIPIGTSSLRIEPYYKLYQNDGSIDVITVFERGDSGQIQRTFEKDSLETEEDFINRMNKRRNEFYANSKITLKPFEAKKYSDALLWNKKRYHTNDVIEYYIDDNASHEFEISMHLMLDEISEFLTAEQILDVKSQGGFITGWFTSNRMKIDFSD